MRKLIETLREYAEWADASIYDVPITLPDTLRRAADAIEELSKPRWIPVTERLPEAEPGGVSERVLVTDGKDVSIVEWFNFEECGPFWGYTGFGEDVTHWMPLPETPKEEK